MILAIHHHNRPQGAAPQAVDGLKGELLVSGRFTGRDAQRAFDLFDDAHPAPHMASGAQTDSEQVLASRLQAESLIEFSHLVHLNKGEAHPLRNPPQGLFGQVMVLSLDVLQ